MIKRLEIFADGSLYELEDEQPVKVTQTEGKVQLLIETLQFTTAEIFAIAPTDAVPRGVPQPRAPMRKTNQEGIKVIKSFEGLHKLKQGPEGTYVEAYLDPVNVPTIGWGSTEGVYIGMKISIAQAEEMLKKELRKFEVAVADAVKTDINDNQFSALVCFSYNVGARSLFESTLLKRLNEGKIQEAADEFLRWDKASGQVFPGLSRRRRAERALFLSQPWEEFLNWEPSRVLRLAEPGQPLVQGNDVRQLQKALVKAGFNIQVDGIFGKDTDKAVRQFQKQKNLTVDGIAGTQTQKALGL
ncbi:glycoside hydrolase family protein [Planktothrix sp. FACHB-1355]|uniref:Lysozyme n=1 Tax=Aerosakkonema funiforme FACHB-1375 TaxID=2949571 RepID=A0A926VGS8_9CYAN|nr:MULTISPECIES: glycoside hydrolase family protein [Oscillatoriales]MBD2183405.1 glycoside hydrolase family protein [Aerosakkonema funiforme FACHB-1375]MBD3557658.1 glycoside hydrolase family protein [Planktothrix sp. FACHB-1355]